MFGVMIPIVDRQRTIRVGELERCQMQAVREAFNHEYEAPSAVAAKTLARACQTKDI